MAYFILIILFGVSVITPVCNIVMQEYKTSAENVMHESIFTVTGTITKVTIVNLSKTIFAKKLVMYLYLKTQNSNEELKFIRKPAWESDKQLKVGQHISVAAKKNDASDYSDIVYIDWNTMPLFNVTGTITKVTWADLSKTARVKKLVVHLNLKTQDSNEELKFIRKPASQADAQLQVGQRVLITAMKDEDSEFSDIVYIEPL